MKSIFNSWFRSGAFLLTPCLLPLASAYEQEAIFKCLSDDTSATITRCTGKDKTVAVPEKIAGLSAGKVGDFAFLRGTTELTIPSGVTEISSKAFSDCPAVKAITIAPDNASCRSVGGVLFNKGGTTLVRFPGEKSGDHAIPVRAENGEIMPYPGRTTGIGNFAFSGCRHLATITVPVGVSRIGDAASLIGRGLDSTVVCPFSSALTDVL